MRLGVRLGVRLSFGVRLMAKVALLFALLCALAFLLAATRYYALAFIVAVLVAVQGAAVLRFANRANRELARLLTAIRHDDFSQGFAIGHLGGSFVELKAAFEDVTRHFRETRMERESQRRYLEALVEHVPVAILAVDEDGTVSLLNSAARRLLDASAAMTLDGLHRYGASFQRDVAQSKSGHRSLTRTELDGVQRNLVLSTTQLRANGANLRLVTLQDIQSELDSSELSAWQDMARVLTHEIMNSLTPIASLASTADELVVELAARPASAPIAANAASAPNNDELVGDLSDAVRTLAKRSDSLMRFVRNYRELTNMPPPAMVQLTMLEYFRGVAQLFAAEWQKRGVVLHLVPPAAGLSLYADESLLDQAIINLLRNAAHAALATGKPDPQVWLEAGLSDRGRTIVEISDNGAGLDEELGEKIFLPFFTTKADGSGIGLALARQVMLVHRGAITAGPRPGGGARFRLTF